MSYLVIVGKNWRSDFEQREKDTLASYASLSMNTRGRLTTSWENDLGESNHRTCWQLDRDRIVYSNSFKRLEHKTQVYIYRLSDHFRTRLTHSFEVSQIARELCRILKLNEDLAEAIAMGHDLGHTPFGHAGERALDKKLKEQGQLGFCHNENSVRILIETEEWSKDWITGKDRYGINPTFELVEGVLKHNESRVDLVKYNKLLPRKPATLEGQAVSMADRFSQRHTDLIDSLKMGLIKQEEYESLIKKHFDQKVHIIKVYMRDVHDEFMKNPPKDIENLRSRDQDSIVFSKPMKKIDDEIRQYIKENVHDSDSVTSLDYRGERIVSGLFESYQQNINLLPKDWRLKIGKWGPKEIIIADYISGMTDRFALQQFERLMGTRFDR